MFEITISMIWVRDGVDSVWMTLSSGYGKKIHIYLINILQLRYSSHYIKQCLCYISIKACEPDYKMFETTKSMILVRDGVDGVRHIWMTLSLRLVVKKKKKIACMLASDRGKNSTIVAKALPWLKIRK
jgi:hypothetical protein